MTPPMTTKERIRLFARDALEAAIAAVASLAITVPANIDDAKREGIIVGVAALSAAIAVARRELLPIILDWLSPKS